MNPSSESEDQSLDQLLRTALAQANYSPEGRDRVLDALDMGDARDSFWEYSRQMWPVLEPSTPLVEGWAIQAIAEHMQAVAEGQIRKLVLNVPPGMSKSSFASVYFQTWVWGPRQWPGARFINASYSTALSIRDNVRARDLMRSTKYRERYPHVEIRPDQDSKQEFHNSKQGWRLATSVGAALTGFRGDFIILDDPNSVRGAESEAEREETARWFLETLPTRVNNPEKSCFVVIQQRVHERDISGIIQKKFDDWEHLILPMRYEPSRKCVTCTGFEDPRVEDGELLFPERFTEKAVADLEATFMAEGGMYAVASQLMQRPAPRGGGLFKEKDFQWYKTAEFQNAGGRYCRGWDLAATTSVRSAYTVGCLMRMTTDKRVIIEDVVRFKGSPQEVYRRILACAENDPAGTTISVPQDPGAAGVHVKQDISRLLHGFDVRFSPESGSKEERATPLAAQNEAGNLYLRQGSWNDDFIAEATVFPAGEYKDQVDAASRAYAELIKKRADDINLGVPTLYT
jgi:predicted phage terminase large subunit-like protein